MRVLLFFFLAVASIAQPVTSPPITAYQWQWTALDSTGGVVNLQGDGPGATATVWVSNDNSPGGSDLFFSFTSTCSNTAQTTGAASTTLVLKGGEKISYDGKWTYMTLKAAAASTVAVRVQAVYNR